MNQSIWHEFAQQYFNFITTELNGLNLTAHRSAEEIYQKQIEDSLLPLEQCNPFKKALESAKYIVDLGTGGGFPLLPMAKSFPNTQCFGVDARNKKLVAVKLIAEHLSLNNISVIHSTFEEIIFDLSETVFLIKAVGKISDILCKLNIEYSSDLFFYKGANFFELEIEELKNLKNNYELAGVHDINVDGLQKRYLVHCRYKGIVPRRTITNGKLKLFSKFS